MNPETRQLKKAPDPAEKALAALEAQVAGVQLCLQRLQERYET
jgi:hypothetical protein